MKNDINLFTKDAELLLAESDTRPTINAISSSIDLIYEHMIKWLFCRSEQKYMWTRGWANTIFKASYVIAVGESRGIYKSKFNKYDLERKYQFQRNKVLNNKILKDLLINEKTVPKDFPAIYNLDLLYRDDFLFDFIIENSYIKQGESDLIHSFNHYRKLRNESKNTKLYCGNGNYKREELY